MYRKQNEWVAGDAHRLSSLISAYIIHITSPVPLVRKWANRHNTITRPSSRDTSNQTTSLRPSTTNGLHRTKMRHTLQISLNSTLSCSCSSLRTAVIPKESAWFRSYLSIPVRDGERWGEGSVDARATTVVEDWIGLRTLKREWARCACVIRRSSSYIVVASSMY